MHMAEPITYFWHKSVPYFILKIMKVYASSISSHKTVPHFTQHFESSTVRDIILIGRQISPSLWIIYRRLQLHF